MTKTKFQIHKNIQPSDWVNIKYKGTTYMVAVSSLLNAYINKPAMNDDRPLFRFGIPLENNP